MLAGVNYAQLLFPDFSLILIGYLVCRYTALNRAVWQPVESLVYYFLFPTLLFYSIIRSPIDWLGTSHLMIAGIGTGLAAILLTYTVPHWPIVGKRMDGRDAAASAQIAFRFNSFIGLALAERLAGAPGLQLISVLIGVCVPMFNIAAVYPMAKGSEHGFARELARNPLIVATIAVLTCNLLGLRLLHQHDGLGFALALTDLLFLLGFRQQDGRLLRRQTQPVRGAQRHQRRDEVANAEH